MNRPKLTYIEARWLAATPLQYHDDAARIAGKAGTGNGRAFSLFARRNPHLFQRAFSGGKFYYRLTPAGAILASEMRAASAKAAEQ